jgi:hypothetical protein
MSGATFCHRCKGRGYFNVRGSGPAARRGGWKRRPCACATAPAACPEPVLELLDVLVANRWPSELTSFADLRQRSLEIAADAHESGRRAALAEIRAALAAMAENAMRAEALAVIDRMGSRG